MLIVFVVRLRCLELIRIRNEFYGSNSVVGFAAKIIDFE